jgi:hypothetical protein
MKIKKNSLIVFFVSIVVYILSIELLNHYYLGDQRFYIRFYDLIYGVSFLKIAPIAISTLSSAEPISWLILWLGSNLSIDKNIWISLLNSLMAGGLTKLLINYQTPFYVIVLTLTNFYFIVLLTGAERLKIAYLILIIALLFKGKSRIFLFLLSPLAHLQSFILLISLYCAHLCDDFIVFLKKFAFSKRMFKSTLTLLIIGAVLALIMQEAILKKLFGYISFDFTLLKIINITILYFLSLIITNRKLEMTFAFIPLFIAAALLGGTRVNMIAFTVVFGFLLFQKQVSHPLFILLLLYYTIKSVLFIKNIYIFNNGFGGSLW